MGARYKGFLRGGWLSAEGLLASLVWLIPELGRAQSGVDVTTNAVELPTRKYIFSEDTRKFKEAESKLIKRITEVEQPPSSAEVDLKAPQVEFQKDKNEISGQGGVLISGMGVQIEADKGSLNLDSNDARAEGRVVVSHSEGVVTADAANFNLDTEIGDFSNAKFTLEDGGYEVNSEKVFKLSETKYKLFNAIFTTCHCADGSKPWYMQSKECRITQEGYAHSFDSTVNMFGVPVFYTPYLGFPAKTERASGLLVPELGWSRRHGALVRLPLFVVWDDSSDSTFTPFVETQSRNGMIFDLRDVLSRESKLTGRFVYSNERPRADDLQGTVVTGMDDPAIDKDRLGGFFQQRWRTKRGSLMDAALVSDIHYVSDNLFLREMDDEQIGDPQSLYTSSSVLGSAIFGNYLSAELQGEYNQAIVSPQDITLQRLPELRADAVKSFRPFGSNPLGFKLVTRLPLTVTDFARTSGYDGWRTNIGPSLAIPLRYGGFFNSAVGLGVLQSYYNLRDTDVPESDKQLEPNQQRTIGTVSYTASTALERVYELEQGNWLTYVTSLGAKNQFNSLARVKHQIEPFFRYLYVPQVSQNALPFFDQLDRMRQKSLFTYGMRTSLLGRFTPRRVGWQDISELTPRPEDLPVLPTDQALSDFGVVGEDLDFGSLWLNRGEIRELAVFSLRQSYDYIQDVKGINPEGHPFSDIGVGLDLYPTQSFGLGWDANYNPYDNYFSSRGLTLGIRDDRGDALRVRATYQHKTLSQIEANLEIALTGRWKAGGYTRYDGRESEFIENRLGVRLSSACDCWHFDLGLRDTINPDRQAVLISFTFGGLGNVAQSFTVNRTESRTGGT